MRAIDADKLIDIFSNLSEYHKYTAVFVDQIIKVINEQPTVKSEKCVAEVSISKEQLEAIITPQIEELKHFLSGWIPVDERLPEDGTWNIFTDGVQISVERYKLDAIDHFFPSGRWFELEQVIAWMPLPEPYKGAAE